jgi:hypothetical protein
MEDIIEFHKRPYKVFDPDKFTIEDVQYAAGLSDTDGCFLIHGSSTKFYIGQAERGMDALHFMHDKFGGAIYLHKRGNEEHQTSFDWTIRGNDAILYANAIIPYLLLKKREAEIFVKYKLGNFTNMALATNSVTKEIKEFDSIKECTDFFEVKAIRFKNGETHINNWKITKKYTEDELDHLNEERYLIDKQLKKFKKIPHDEISNKIIPSMAWRGGVLDGEATFDTNGKSGQHHSITQKYKPLLELFKRLYGGSLYVNKASNTYAWQVHTEANKMLKDVADHIRGKKKQVELILNMKPGEAPKVHLMLRELKGNHTALTPRIDALKEGAHGIRATVTKPHTEPKQLPTGVFKYGKNNDQCIAQIQYDKKVYRLGVFTIGEKQTAHELYIKYKEAISAEKRGGPKVNFEKLEFTERNKK